MSPNAGVLTLECQIPMLGHSTNTSVVKRSYPNEFARELSRIIVKDDGNWQIITIIVHELSQKIAILIRTVFHGFSWKLFIKCDDLSRKLMVFHG